MEEASIVGEIEADGLRKMSRVNGNLHKDIKSFDCRLVDRNYKRLHIRDIEFRILHGLPRQLCP